jgi:hypothetical protein
MNRAFESRLSRPEVTGEVNADWVGICRSFFPDDPPPATDRAAFLKCWHHISDSLDDPPKLKEIEEARGEHS